MEAVRALLRANPGITARIEQRDATQHAPKGSEERETLCETTPVGVHGAVTGGTETSRAALPTQPTTSSESESAPASVTAARRPNQSSNPALWGLFGART